jgi:hypothetical protein
MLSNKICDEIKRKSFYKNGIIYIGNILELVVTHDCIDVYKYVDRNKICDDYNWDSDYITTIYME